MAVSGEEVSPGTEGRPLLEDVTRQRMTNMTENTILCVIVICKV
jgi:hypothetical protein